VILNTTLRRLTPADGAFPCQQYPKCAGSSAFVVALIVRDQQDERSGWFQYRWLSAIAPILIARPIAQTEGCCSFSVKSQSQSLRGRAPFRCILTKAVW
jgi:hypothetical protein